MTVSERRTGDVTVLDLKGRLVLEEGVDPLRERIDSLIAQGRTRIVIDVRDVTYVDSCGIGLLIGKLLSARRRDGDVRLLHLTRRSHHLMEITRLLDVFRTYDSEAEAIASFSEHPTK